MSSNERRSLRRVIVRHTEKIDGKQTSTAFIAAGKPKKSAQSIGNLSIELSKTSINVHLILTKNPTQLTTLPLKMQVETFKIGNKLLLL